MAKNIVLISVLLILCVLAFYLGNRFYKKTLNNKFQDNVASMVYNLRSEFEQVNTQLQRGNITPEFQSDLETRRAKLVKDINLFYGE